MLQEAEDWEKEKEEEKEVEEEEEEEEEEESEVEEEREEDVVLEPWRTRRYLIEGFSLVAITRLLADAQKIGALDTAAGSNVAIGLGVQQAAPVGRDGQETGMEAASRGGENMEFKVAEPNCRTTGKGAAGGMITSVGDHYQAFLEQERSRRGRIGGRGDFRENAEERITQQLGQEGRRCDVWAVAEFEGGGLTAREQGVRLAHALPGPSKGPATMLRSSEAFAQEDPSVQKREIDMVT